MHDMLSSSVKTSADMDQKVMPEGQAQLTERTLRLHSCHKEIALWE